jgi:predicted secreted protein
MTHGPGLTYDLTVSTMEERNRVRTGAVSDQPSSPQVGRLRLSLATMLISVGEWLGGSARVSPATGTN